MSSQEDQKEVIEVNDLDLFVQTMEAWHAAKIGTLRGMMAIPSGSGIEVEDPDGKKHMMEGEFYKGYMVALVTALGIFGTLPFEQIEDEPAQPAH